MIRAEGHIRKHGWDAVNDETGYYVPADLAAWSDAFMGQLDTKD